MEYTKIPKTFFVPNEGDAGRMVVKTIRHRAVVSMVTLVFNVKVTVVTDGIRQAHKVFFACTEA